jgi:hypothetical protein
MDPGLIDFLRELTQVLKDGGAYAGWALFVCLWLVERRYSAKLVESLRTMAVAQVENNVETRLTMKTLGEGLAGIEYEQGEVKEQLRDVMTDVRRLLPAHKEKR